MADAELTFEQAYAELEQTAQSLQQGQLSLDETLRLSTNELIARRYEKFRNLGAYDEG